MSAKTAKLERQRDREQQRILLDRPKTAEANELLATLLGRPLEKATLVDGAARILNDVLDVHEAAIDHGFELDLHIDIVWEDPNSHLEITEEQMEAEISGSTLVWLPQPVNRGGRDLFSLSIAGMAPKGNTLLTAADVIAAIRKTTAVS